MEIKLESDNMEMNMTSLNESCTYLHTYTDKWPSKNVLIWFVDYKSSISLLHRTLVTYINTCTSEAHYKEVCLHASYQSENTYKELQRKT